MSAVPRTGAVTCLRKESQSRPGHQLQKLVDAILSSIRSGVGFTICPQMAREVEADAWAVSIRGSETQFRQLPLREALETDVRNKLRSIQDSLEPLFFGGWSQGGIYYLDLSRLISDQSQAIAVAQVAGQAAVYHLRNQETLWVRPYERRAA